MAHLKTEYAGECGGSIALQVSCTVIPTPALRTVLLDMQCDATALLGKFRHCSVLNMTDRYTVAENVDMHITFFRAYEGEVGHVVFIVMHISVARFQTEKLFQGLVSAVEKVEYLRLGAADGGR
jgi:hypothetical protein